jgi:hypothetical protein
MWEPTTFGMYQSMKYEEAKAHYGKVLREQALIRL